MEQASLPIAGERLEIPAMTAVCCHNLCRLAPHGPWPCAVTTKNSSTRIYEIATEAAQPKQDANCSESLIQLQGDLQSLLILYSIPVDEKQRWRSGVQRPDLTRQLGME